MWNDFAEYILNQKDNLDKNSNYDHKGNDINNNSSFKVVEIAIGKFFNVSNYLSNIENIEFIATDIDPAKENIVFDDIINPNIKIYDDADILYSIRPPQELQPYINNIVNETGATLIIKPLFNEDLNLNLNMKLVNYKKAVFYESI